MRWQKVCDEAKDVNYKSDLMRAILRMKHTRHTVAGVIARMDGLPVGLQSYIAWDIVCDPVATAKQYDRVKNNLGLLAVTSEENIQRAFNRCHEGNLTTHAADRATRPDKPAVMAQLALPLM